MDQKTLDEVIRSLLLCIYKHLEILADRVHKSLIGNNLLPDTLSLSLGGIRLSLKQARRVNQRLAYHLQNDRTITEICRQSSSVLTYPQLTDVLL